MTEIKTSSIEMDSSPEANKLYETSANLASEANELANKGLGYYQKYEEINEMLTNWDRIHATTPFKTYTLVFLIACIVEFYFSKLIYEDIIQQMPAWLIASGLTGISIITSKLLKKSFNQASRERAIYMEQKKPGNQDKPYVTLRDKVHKDSKKSAILGWLIFAGLVVIISYLSYLRATRELAAHVRFEKFNIVDSLPIVFYVVEVLSGLFFVYTIDRIIKGIIRKSQKSQYDKYINKCSELTDEAVKYFKEAKTKGYNPSFNAVNENIHLAFFRNMQRNITREYFKRPEVKYRFVQFKFISDTHKKGNVTIVTECNFSAMTAFEISNESSKSEVIRFEINGFETDSVRELIFDFPNTKSPIDLIIKGNFEMNSVTHEINIDQ